MGLPGFIQRNLKIKDKGWKEWELIATSVALFVAGGEHMDDMSILHSDKAYQQLTQMKEGLPSAKALERFLKRFHNKVLIGNRPKDAKAWVPEESEELKKLAVVEEHISKRLIKLSGLETVTIENDASVILSQKEECLGTYKGGIGYVPVVGTIAELGIVVADEFRDGNTPPAHNIQKFFEKCLSSLPKTVKQVCTRLDGAYYEHDFMDYLDGEGIEFTITGEKRKGFLEWVEAMPEKEWKPLMKITAHGSIKTGREWAELDWVSAGGTRKSRAKHIRRYIVTRKTERQWELFQEDAIDEVTEKDRYEVIVTNRDWYGSRLIRWHNERAGSIEHTIDRVKNDYAGRVLPCAEFGANAAWWRLQCIAHNLVRALQIHALPEALSECRLKKLRLWLFCVAGRVVRTGRQLILKLIGNHPSFEIYKDARCKIACMTFP